MNPVDEFRESILQAQIEAALSGHDVTAFEPVDERGFQAICRNCGQTVWVGITGLMYSLLSDLCPLAAAESCLR